MTVRKSQKAIFVTFGTDAFDVAANPADPLFGLINAAGLTSPKPDPRDTSRYLMIPGSTDNDPNNGSINNERYEKFLSTVPLHGPTGAMALDQLSYVSFEFYPHWLRLTNVQYNGECPAYIPDSIWTDPEEIQPNRQMTWQERLAIGGNPAQIEGSTDWLAGDMANYGIEWNMSIAAQLVTDGYTVLSRDDRLSLTTESGLV